MYRIEFNGTVIYDLSQQDDSRFLLEPKYSGEVGKVDTLDFTILPSHPYFNTFTRLQTGIVAYRDNVEIFRGRILSTTLSLMGQKEVQCEGNLAYLLDSIQPKMTYEDGISCEQLFRNIIANHNQQVEAAKQFTVGNITANKRADIIDVNQTSFTETRSMIDSYLLNTKGGYLRTRYENGVQYIDWVEDFSRRPNQTIRVGTNVIDFSEEISADEFYTVLLPTGTITIDEDDYDSEEEVEQAIERGSDITIESVNGGSKYLYVSQDFINRYGYIYHNEDFGDVEGPGDLLNRANEVLARYRQNLHRSIEITGLDLHILDPNVDQLLLGDRVEIIAPKYNKDETLLLTKIDYEFQKPEADKFSFGETLKPLSRKTEQSTTSVSSQALKNKNESKNNSNVLKLNKKLIDIQTENMNVKVKDTFNLETKIMNFVFEKLNWRSTIYEHPIDEVIAKEAAFEAEAGTIKRWIAGTVDPEQGIANFEMVSQLVGDTGRLTNRLYQNLDSDAGFFEWSVQQQRVNANEERSRTAYMLLYGDSITGQPGLFMGVKDPQGIYKFNGDNFISAINLDGNQAFIRAQRINLDGYTSGGNVRINNMVIVDDLTGFGILTYPLIYLGTTESRRSVGSAFSSMKIENGVLKAFPLGAESPSVDSDWVTVGNIYGSNVNPVFGTINAGTLNGTGTLTYPNMYLGTSESRVSVGSALRDIRVTLSGSTYTMEALPLGSDTWVQKGTFSRATTLSGAWSSGILTVSASPQGNSITFGLADVPSSDVSWSGNTASFPVKANLDGGETLYNTGKTLSVDASGRYNAGYNNGHIAGYIEGYDDNTTARVNQSSRTLDYGESVTVTAQYIDYDGTVHNTSSSCTITAPARGSAYLSLIPSSHTVTVAASGTFSSATVSVSGSIGSYYEGYYPVNISAKIGTTEMATGTVNVSCEQNGSWRRGYDACNEHYETVSAKRASNLTQAFSSRTALFYWDSSRGEYAPAGSYYWFRSNTSGFETLYEFNDY